MNITADLHIHSRYSAATSKYISIDGLAHASKIKGISLLGTGDFTHPLWLKEIKEKLKESEEGIYTCCGAKFILSVEISNVFEKDGKTYKIHTVLLSPNIHVAEQINETLSKIADLRIDGRPTINASIEETLELLHEVDKNIAIIAAHVWTPWFSLFGSKFGGDSVEEVYGKYSPWLLALETGLSSDPPMNWAVEENQKWPLVSNSDAHSLETIGREATKLSTAELSYTAIINAIKGGKGIVKTYEYFPQEGKYFWDGHRKCDVCLSPEESSAYNNICPVCKKKLTLGVLHRIADLGKGLEAKWKEERRKAFQHIIPLKQLISKVVGKRAKSKAVEEIYDKVIRYFGNELAVYEADEEFIRMVSPSELAQAILKVKREEVFWRPGCDGVFGTFSFERPKEEGPKQQRLTDIQQDF